MLWIMTAPAGFQSDMCREDINLEPGASPMQATPA